MPDEPVPMTATRLPVKSTPSCGQVEVKYTSPANRSAPSMSAAFGIDRQPLAITRWRQLTSSPRSVRTCHSDAASSHVGRLDAGRELDVASEVVLVGDVLGVAQDLGLRRVLLRPRPLALEGGIEAVGVVGRRDVAPGAGIAVPVPRTPDVVGGLERSRREPQTPQSVQEVEPGETGSPHYYIDIWNIDIGQTSDPFPVVIQRPPTQRPLVARRNQRTVSHVASSVLQRSDHPFREWLRRHSTSCGRSTRT